MSDTSEDLILPSSQELKDAEAARKTQWEKSSAKDSNGVESDQENENAEDSSKSPPKIHRTATAMAVEETVEEIEFREKYFEDNHEALTKLKLRCTACSSSLTSVVLKGRNVFHHPVLRVLMCKQCINFYGDGNFSMDEDGSDKYCRWCGQGGMLYCCSTCCCAFCKRCIKQNLNRSILKDIESEDWQCFVCNGKPLWELRAICVNAQSYSMKMRCRQEGNQCNIKQLKKKRTQLKQKSRLLSQKNFSTKSSSDDDTSLNEMQELSRNRRKQNFGNSLSESEECEKKVKNGSVTENNASVSDIGASTDSEEVSSGDFKKRRNRKKKSKRELSKVGRNSSAAEKRSKTESKQGSEIADKKKLPKELEDVWRRK
ncbi:transcriptional regulator ATRX-like [Zootermopsis nevadensis]|uniref:transcriptional regulator ATRX-like n=1 Tax=Zootermopsis nevadensis TaxID=136037 RepID=UPI000B8EAA46|nr:transcriptional regulator ATRX-like [Zootermopsis nevadensis]